MKTLIFILSFLFCFVQLSAQQSDLVIYSVDNQQFFLILDDAQQNEQAGDYVKVQAVNSGLHEIEILFVNNNLNNIKTTVYLSGKQTSSFLLRKTQGLSTNNAAYHDYDLVAESESNTNLIQHKSNTIISSGSVTTMDMYNPSPNEMNLIVNPSTGEVKTVVSNPAPCNSVISNDEFNRIKAVIIDAAFIEDKIDFSKDVLEIHCLSVDQFSQILPLLGEDQHRIMLSEFAYNYLYDAQNFRNLEPSFDNLDTFNELLLKVFR